MSKIPKIFIFFLIISAAFKCLLLFNPEWLSFDSDQAVMGLMAMHTGPKEFPLFYYGQNYGGGLEHLLAGLAFKIFPHTIVTLRAVAVFLLWWCEALFLLSLNHRTTLNHWQALLATVFFSFSSLHFLTFFNVLYGSHLNSLFYMCLWLFLWNKSQRWSDYAFLKGLVIGLGIWHSYFLILYIVPSITALVITRNSMPLKLKPSRAFQFISAIILGAVPRIYYWLYPESWRVNHRGSDYYFFFDGLWTKTLAIFTKSLPEFYFGQKWLTENSFFNNFVVIIFFSIFLYSCLMLIRDSFLNFKQEDRFIPLYFIFLAGGCALSMILASPEGSFTPTRFIFPVHFLISLSFGHMAIIQLKSILQQTKLASLAKMALIAFIFFISSNFVWNLTQGNLGDSEEVSSQRAKLITILNEQQCSKGYAGYPWAYLLDFLSHEKTIFVPFETSRVQAYEENLLNPITTGHKCFLLSSSNQDILVQLKKYWEKNPQIPVKKWQFGDQILYIETL